MELNSARQAVADGSASKPPRLDQLCTTVIIKHWRPSASLEGPRGETLDSELAKKLWSTLKSEQARQGETVTCALMYPFVRSAWRIDTLDLSDSGKWIHDSSLAALAFITTLQSVRLTACRFISDDGLSFVPSLQLHTLDVSWTPISDAGVANHIVRCPSLKSLNFTGNNTITDRGISSLLCLTGLRRLALCATGISDAGLDYLTYYTRYPDTQKGTIGLDHLEWLELSNTR